MAASRPRPLPPTGRNHVWAYDFVFDNCANGQQLKCLTIIDEWTRECLAIEVAGSIRSTRVIEQLARLVSVHGAPRYLRSDNGPEFVSTAVMRWLLDAKIDAAHIAPTLQAALDDWNDISPRLEALATDLEHATIPRDRFHTVTLEYKDAFGKTVVSTCPIQLFNDEPVPGYMKITGVKGDPNHYQIWDTNLDSIPDFTSALS